MWTQIRLLLQEQSDFDVHCLSKRRQIFQQTTKAYKLFFVIFALTVNKYEFSFYTVRIFMKCTHVCMAQTSSNSLPNRYNLIPFNEPIK